jgi:hypothetical protein
MMEGPFECWHWLILLLGLMACGRSTELAADE